jgi:lipase
MSSLNVEVFGPADGPTVLAIHGLTGHGKRWVDLAAALPQVRIVAPDLLGHGFSPFAPPWSIDAQVAALTEVIDEYIDGPVVVVAHSYGGALALHLSRLMPNRFRRLILLDPAIGLDPALLEDVATSYLSHYDYPDEAAAREGKLGESWAELTPAILDREIADHLIDVGDRVNWRIHPGMVVTTWSELARPFVLPPADVPVDLVQAMQVQPPYVTAAFRAALSAQQGDLLTVFEEDCGHMVPFARPELTAKLVSEALSGQ